MSKKATSKEAADEDDDSIVDDHIRPNFPAVTASNTSVRIKY